LIQQVLEIADRTESAYDPTSMPLVRLWRRCRDELRTPTDDEIAAVLELVGTGLVVLNAADDSIRFERPGVELNLNGIGKGYALDREAELLLGEDNNEWLLHGGRSSVLARGDHNGLGGWPVGIGNPLFRETRLATLILKDQAMGTSGSGTQFFRVEGRRFGHILDPRTGWPVSDMLSVTVVAPDAALADALATAFFVLGVEKATECLHTWDGVGAILIPRPERGRHLRPVVIGVPDEQIFWDVEQAEPGRPEQA
jgi:thiamine biosynthesis lipoprotein